MAGIAVLVEVFNETELSALTDSSKDKLERHLLFLQKQIDEFKSKYENIRVNSEQQYFDVEKQLITSNTKLEAQLVSNADLRQQVTDLESKYDEASSKLRTLQDAQEGSLSTKLRLTKVNEQLEVEKREFAVRLEKRNKEIDNLNDELQRLSQKLSETNEEKCEAILKHGEIRSNEVNMEYQIKRLQQEEKNLQKQLDSCNSDLADKSRQLLSVRRETSTKMLEYQSKFEDKNEEASLLTDTVQTLKRTNAEQATKIDTFIQRIKDIQDSHSQSEEQYRQEIEARIRLVDLYKGSVEDSESKGTELTGAVSELQKLLKEAAKAHTDMEAEKDEAANELRAEISLQEERVANLQQELLHANELLDAVKGKSVSDDRLESLFPTASATSKILKSGMSLSQIYHEFVQASDSLELEKAENKRLNNYLDAILQEIEEKAPQLKQQRLDYEEALASIDRMTRQLDTARLDFQNLREEADSNHRKASHLDKESLRQRQQIKDLSSQVKTLVKEIQEVHGGRFVHDASVSSSSEAMDSSGVISEKLVTFRNIQELQEQNQRLLAVVRELGEKREAEETAATDAKTRGLQEKLELAQDELSELRDARTRQADMVESIVRQRDMYKVLVQQLPSSPAPVFGSATKTPTKSPGVLPLESPGGTRKLDEANMALKQLQAEFASYKRERLENEKLVTEQIDKARKDCSDLRVQNAKLGSQLEFAAERYKVVHGNADGYRKEIALFRDKNQKYSTAIAKHEQKINILKEELMVTQEQLAQSVARVDNIRAEKDLIRSSEQRLNAELEASRRERQSQMVLMANLQTIQNNLERNEYETKQRFSKQVDDLDREKTFLKKRLESEDKQHSSAVDHWERQVKEVRQQLDMEIKAHHQTRTSLVDDRKQQQDLEQQLSSTTAKLTSAELRLSNLSPDDSGYERSKGEIRDLKTQLTQTKSDVDKLTSELQKSRQHAEQYRTMADSIQDTLKDQNQTNKEFKENMEEKIREAQEASEHLQQRLDGLEKERQELLADNIKITEESHNLNAELRKQLSSIQLELQESIDQREVAMAQEATALRDCEEQARVAKDAQDNYERELMLHAADIEALAALKKELEEYGNKLEAKAESRKAVETRLKESQESWTFRESTLVEENESLSSKVQEIMDQNLELNEQLSLMSSQVIEVQEKAVTDPPGADGRTEDSTKSSEQLLEVVRYLRKDKDIAEGKLNVVETECSRMRQRCDTLEKDLNFTSRQLAEERQQIQVEVHTMAQHADLMHKVESISLLQDSNKLLREERDSSQAQVTQTEAKLKKLEDDIKPLQEVIRQLQSDKEALLMDKKAIVGEAERWRNRTNQLIEQSHRADPEEYRKLVNDKEEMRKQVNTITEELHKSKIETNRLSAEISKLERQIKLSKEEFSKQKNENTKEKEELESAKKDVGTKSDEIAEKQKTINQLKKIGRKYKEQAEVIKKELDDLRKSEEGQATAQQASSQQVATAEQRAQQAEGDRDRTRVELTEAQGRVGELEQTLKDTKSCQEDLEGKLREASTDQDELRQKLEASSQSESSEAQSLKEEVQKLTEEVTRVKEGGTKLQEEKDEMDKKLNRSNMILQTAKTKLQSMKDITDKLSMANSGLNEKLAATERTANEEADLRVTSVKTMYENQVRNLEQDLAAVRTDRDHKHEEVDRLLKDISDLQNKVQQLQRQVEGKVGTSQVHVVSRPTASTAPDRTSASPSEPPKTANIRPIAASSPAAIKPQTVPVQPQAQSAASKATASIRPMAITSISAATGTPTATVMPTTVSQQDSSSSTDGDGQIPVQQLFPAQGVSRPTQQVQRVVPTQESVQEVVPEVATETNVVEPSTSRETPVASVGATGKRQREDVESPSEETIVKRTKTSTDEQHVIPSITVTSDTAQTSEVDGQTQDEQVDITDFTTEASEGESRRESGITDQDEEEDDDVVVVGSSESEGGEEEEEGDEEEEYDDEGEEQYEEEEEPDDTDIYEGLEGEEYDEDGDGDDDMQDNGGQAQDDDDDVVIIDEGDEEGQMGSQQADDRPSIQPQTSQLLPPLQPLIAPPERQLSSGTRNQLTPFMLGVHPSPFEDGDDGIVPSTPTLVIPRHGDGFAEAVSSPQVSQRFIFGSGGESHLTLSGLAQVDAQAALGMGMDDTRMDLSQLEEGSGRSVPSTPLHTSAPVTITESLISQSETSVTAGQSATDLQSTEVEPEASQSEELLEDDLDDMLEGDQGDDDHHDDDGEFEHVEQETGETSHDDDRTGDIGEQGDDPATSPQDRSQDPNRPKIQKIVWDSPSAPGPSQPPGATPSIPQPSHSQPAQQFSRGRAPQRGLPAGRIARSGGAFHQRGQQGQRSRPRGRGGSFSRRPPMY